MITFYKTIFIIIFSILLINCITLAQDQTDLIKYEYGSAKIMHSSLYKYYNFLSLHFCIKDYEKLLSMCQDYDIIAVPRICTWGNISNIIQSTVVKIIGIDLLKDKNIFPLHELIIKGKYPSSNHKGILIGSELAEYLELQIDDSIVLLVNDKYGFIKSMEIKITGIFHSPLKVQNRQYVYISLDRALQLFTMEGMITEICLYLPDEIKAHDRLIKLKQEIQMINTSLIIIDYKALINKLSE